MEILFAVLQVGVYVSFEMPDRERMVGRCLFEIGFGERDAVPKAGKALFWC